MTTHTDAENSFETDLLRLCGLGDRAVAALDVSLLPNQIPKIVAEIIPTTLPGSPEAEPESTEYLVVGADYLRQIENDAIDAEDLRTEVARLERELRAYGSENAFVEVGWIGDESVGIPGYSNRLSLCVDRETLDELPDEERGAIREALKRMFESLGEPPEAVRFCDECPDCLRSDGHAPGCPSGPWSDEPFRPERPS